MSTSAMSSAVAAASTASSISFASSAPTNAVSVPQNFVGFGLETANFNNYTTIFSQNLINSIGARMATPPTIRIGGTTGDNLHYNPAQKENITCSNMPSCKYSFATHFVLGPSYFDGFTSFTPNKMTFQAPLSANVNKTNVVDFVTHAYSKLGASRLAAIAVGNEPSYYKNTTSYNSAVHEVESYVVDALGFSGASQDIFEVGDIDSGQASQGSPWTLQAAFSDGLNSNGEVKIAAEHYYQINSMSGPPGGFTPANLQTYLMSHEAITNKYKPFITTMQGIQNQKQGSGIPFVLSETGAVLGGPYNFSNVFGSCLWSVDFHLYGMSVGVARIDGSQRPSATHSLWIPNPVPGVDASQVRANWYAQPYIADFVSSSNAKQEVIESQDLGSPYLSAYAMYSAGRLARVALVNLNMWPKAGGSTSDSRPKTVFPVSVPAGTTSVTVQRLVSPAGALASGYDVNQSETITWAGLLWSSTKGNGEPQTVGTTSETINVVNGVANVPVPDTEAVIVFI